MLSFWSNLTLTDPSFWQNRHSKTVSVSPEQIEVSFEIPTGPAEGAETNRGEEGPSFRFEACWTTCAFPCRARTRRVPRENESAHDTRRDLR